MRGMTDIHCHILPGVDDGAQSLEEARELLKMQQKDGVKSIILTPHYRPGMFEPSVSQIYQSLQKLTPIAEELGIRLLMGREYHVSSRFEEHIRDKVLPTMGDSKYVLTEFSTRHSYGLINRVLSRMLDAGYRPVIAHVERYPEMNDKKRVAEVYRLGAYIQINAGSLMGEEKRPAKKFCIQLMKEDLIHFIASDAHRLDERKPNLGACCHYVEKKMGSEYAETIFCENPLMLIKNREI